MYISKSLNDYQKTMNIIMSTKCVKLNYKCQKPHGPIKNMFSTIVESTKLVNCVVFSLWLCHWIIWILNDTDDDDECVGTVQLFRIFLLLHCADTNSILDAIKSKMSHKNNKNNLVIVMLTIFRCVHYPSILLSLPVVSLIMSIKAFFCTLSSSYVITIS